MPGPRRPHQDEVAGAAEALIGVAPLAARWIERLLASHAPPLTLAQFLTLRALAGGAASGTELARRAGVSGPAVSQLLAALAAAGLLERRELDADRRRLALALSSAGERTLVSAQELLRARMSALLAELPPPEAGSLSRALPEVEALLAGTPPPRRPPPSAPRPRHRPPGRR
jgi:DNA-binding MarR family transcriptional regulator